MSNKKKMLILGGGYADIPLIKSAQNLGYYVVTTGNRTGDLGHNYSDEFQFADFSDKEVMLQLAERLKVDAVCACCNDFSALSAAYIAEKLGLPGHDTYKITKLIHHKDLYRAFAQENGILSPKALSFSSLKSAYGALDQFHFPIMIKPVDLTGGKGVSKVESIKDAKVAIEKALQISREKKVVIEEFIEGGRHGFSTFIRNGEVVFYFNDNEHYYLNQYLVSAASVPGYAPAAAVSKLCKAAEKISSLLNLTTGIFHIQYILHQNEPVIIEVCRRAPGDLYIQLVEHATGVDYASYIVRGAAGLDCGNLSQSSIKGFFSRSCIMPRSNGRLQSLEIDSSIQKNIIDECMWWNTGDVVDDFMTHKFGILFLRYDSAEEMLQKTENIHDFVHLNLF